MALSILVMFVNNHFLFKYKWLNSSKNRNSFCARMKETTFLFLLFSRLILQHPVQYCLFQISNKTYHINMPLNIIKHKHYKKISHTVIFRVHFSVYCIQTRGNLIWDTLVWCNDIYLWYKSSNHRTEGLVNNDIANSEHCTAQSRRHGTDINEENITTS